MGNPVVHFEIYGRNTEQLNAFYSQAFGWDIHTDNPMNHGMIHTNADGKGIEGGTSEGDPRVNIVIEVPDLEEALATIESIGGKTVTPPTEVPGVTFAAFSDPEGNVVGVVKAE